MNIFIVRDFARTDSSEPLVQVCKKEEKKHLVSRSLIAKKTITCYSFSAKGVGEGNIILALSILTGVGGGSRDTKFLHGRSIFQGPDVLVSIPMEPFTTCDFPVGPGLPAPSGSVLAPSLDSVWICLFVFYSLRTSQRNFSYVGTILPVLNKY